MVKRVPAPAEHYLITQGQNLVTQFGSETLSKFAVQKLLEHKMTSRNFKAGLDFTDHYKAQKARDRLGKMVLTHIEKELAWVYKEGVTRTPFLAKHWSRTEQLCVKTFYDKAVLRYLSKIERLMIAAQIPLRFTITSYNYEEDFIEVVIHPTANNRSSMNYYRIMFYLNEIVQFFRCLSKKALFTDEATRSLNRSKFSGYFPTRSAERNTRSASTAEAAVNHTAVRRGVRSADLYANPATSLTGTSGTSPITEFTIGF